jgi:hypothetical protein
VREWKCVGVEACGGESVWGSELARERATNPIVTQWLECKRVIHKATKQHFVTPFDDLLLVKHFSNVETIDVLA